MSTKRITVTLSEEMAEQVRQRAKRTGLPVSQVVARAIESEERRRTDEELAEQYKAAAKEAETRNVARDVQALDATDWPED